MTAPERTASRTARTAWTAIADRLADYDRLLEVGIGRRPAVAARLVTAGAAVAAIDVRPVSTPDGVAGYQADVVEWSRGRIPQPAARADAVYALNLPPELHRPTLALARRADATCLFTTLGHDPPAVPVDIEQVGGETVYVARR